MWVVMMVAMMLPSFVPMLLRIACLRTSAPSGVLTALVSASYAFVWTAFGVAVYPVGAIFSVAAMRASSNCSRDSSSSRPGKLGSSAVAGTPHSVDGPFLLTTEASVNTRFAHGPSLHIVLFQIYDDPARHRRDELRDNGPVDRRYFCRAIAPKPEWAARAAGVVTIASAFFMIARTANT
jgi:hypothetical protein